MSRLQPRGGSAGVCTVNREDLRKSFLDVPKEAVTSLAHLKSAIDSLLPILSKSQEDWTKRMKELKRVRSLIISAEESVERSQLIAQLARLTDCLEMSVKDLRSQIVREAAITCSFIVEKFGNDVHQIGEAVLAAGMSQVAVSTKIMATSGAALSAFVVEFVQTKQIFTTITSFSTSKDKAQRRQLQSLLEIVITNWNDKVKRQFLRQICEMIRAGVNDADSETRAAGRAAFAKLDELHTEEAEQLFKLFDASKQKMLRSGDAASSSTSVNSERSLPIRSKLSAGSRAVPNISQKFLSQRSASAIDTKQISMRGPHVSTPGARPTMKTMTKVDTSPGGSKFTRPGFSMARTNSNLRGKPSMLSQPGSRNTSPPRRTSSTASEIQRVKSNLGNNSFLASLTQEQSDSLQNVMNNVREQLRQPSKNDDDDFLLPKRPIKTPQKSALDISRVEAVIRACSSSSQNEKKEGIKMLTTVVTDPTLSDIEIKNIGNTLNRLLGDVANTMVLDSITFFVQTHHSRLSDWLKEGLKKLFTKKGSETMPNQRKQIAKTLDAILSSMDSRLQLRSISTLICDPIVLLPPKARIVALEYLNDLLKNHMERGSAFNTKENKQMIMKIFSWMSDQKIGQTILPHAENVLCSFFALNAADFSALFSDFNADYRNWAYQILQSHGHDEANNKQSIAANVEEEEQCVRTTISNTAAQIEDFVGQSTRRNLLSGAERSNSPRSVLQSTSPHQKLATLGPLQPLDSTLNSTNGVDHDDFNLNESFDRLKLNSTHHLADDTSEQNNFVQAKLNQMLDFSNQSEQHEGLLAIHTMLCEGSFTLWEQNFAKLLLAVFEVLSKAQSDINKKLALRVLMKMCTAQAARLFDSTEMAVCKVIDAAVDSTDGTMNVTADDCLKTLATHLPLAKVVNIAKLILKEPNLDDARAALVLKMITRLFEGLESDELAPILDEIAPVIVLAYNSPSMPVRKASVYCLVAMMNKLGKPVMDKHLAALPHTKLNLLQVYVNRAMSSSAHSHV